MKYPFNQSLPYLQKLVMVSFVIVTMFMLAIFPANPAQASMSGSLRHSLESRDETLTITLVGVSSYELAEIFNDVIENTPGVLRARRCQLHLDPKRPRSCQVEWQISFTGTTPFAIESDIYNRLKQIGLNPDHEAGFRVNGSIITLTDNEYLTLKTIKPWQSSAGRLRFVETEVFADNLPRYRPDHEHPPVNRWSHYPNYGFE